MNVMAPRPSAYNGSLYIYIDFFSLSHLHLFKEKLHTYKISFEITILLLKTCCQTCTSFPFALAHLNNNMNKVRL